MKMTYYFFQNDLVGLANQIAEVEQRLKKVMADASESCEQSSETWHDNFGFEDGQRQIGALSKQMEELQQIRTQAALFTPPSQSPDTVQLGTRVTFIDHASSQTQTITIGSYMIFGKQEGTISYQSPLAQLIMGAEVGDIREGKVANTDKRVEILSIQ